MNERRMASFFFSTDHLRKPVHDRTITHTMKEEGIKKHSKSLRNLSIDQRTAPASGLRRSPSSPTILIETIGEEDFPLPSSSRETLKPYGKISQVIDIMDMSHWRPLCTRHFNDPAPPRVVCMFSHDICLIHCCPSSVLAFPP